MPADDIIVLSPVSQQQRGRSQSRSAWSGRCVYLLLIIFGFISGAIFDRTISTFHNVLANEASQLGDSAQFGAPIDGGHRGVGDTPDLVLGGNGTNTITPTVKSAGSRVGGAGEPDLSTLRQVDEGLHHSSPPIFEHETILGSLMGGLIRESQSGIVSLVPSEGLFLDAGMQFGEFGAHMAVSGPSRHVLMIDPSPTHVASAQSKFGRLANLEIMHGGLGSSVGTMKARDESFNMQVGAEFPLYTVDSLFYDKGRKLAFAHWDVEGLELDVLRGARATIKDSKPIFTTEVRVHQNHTYTNELLEFIFELGYDSYVINEVCGFPHMDYRNLLNIPRTMNIELMKSDTFSLLDATRAFARVPPPSEGNDGDIFRMVLPCCELGKECCLGTNINAQKCCNEANVMKWLGKAENHPEANPYMFTWKAARTELGRFRYRLRKRTEIP